VWAQDLFVVNKAERMFQLAQAARTPNRMFKLRGRALGPSSSTAVP
jgi:hypothetical protein